eukprot:Mrub_00752.p1 GENE.Mrub_00752~~Mrub_00752.p1  ORF type:complete len:867 (+),score=144.70 Mrub_00752:169-2601(+)
MHKNKIQFDKKETYLYLVIKKNTDNAHNIDIEYYDIVNNLVNSTCECVSPRGLNNHIFNNNKSNKGYSYTINISNGIESSDMCKAVAVSYAVELDMLFSKVDNPVLYLLFHGAVVRRQKLQKGEILCIQDYFQKDFNLKEEYSSDKNKIIKQYNRNIIKPLKFILNIDDNKSYNQIFSFKKELESHFNSRNTSMFSIYSKKAVDLFRSNGDSSRDSNKENYSDRSSGYIRSDQEDNLININHHYSSLSNPNHEIKSKKPNLGLNINLDQIRLDNDNKFNNVNVKSLQKDLKDKNDKEISKNTPQQPNSNRQSDVTESRQSSDITERSDQTTPKSSTRVPILRNFSMLNSDDHYNKLLKNYDPTKAEVDFSEEDWMIKDTARKVIKLDYFKDKISPMYQDHLYVGGISVAKNKELLKQTGITHIINCSSDICENYFDPDFKYLNYFLRDTANENIECLFYDSIDFIHHAVNVEKGRVFVHCYQGVSRSVTVCMAYNIYLHNISYQDCLISMRKTRGICNPNMGFTVQLMMFYDRLYSEFDKIKHVPRVFAVSGFQKEQPHKIVCRFQLEKDFYEGRDNVGDVRVFDSRGVYIVSSESKNYIWVGSDVGEETKKAYLKKATKYVDCLNKNEKHHKAFEIINQNSEPMSYWSLFKLSKKPDVIAKKYEKFDSYYMDLSQSYTTYKPGYNSHVLKSYRDGEENKIEETEEEEYLSDQDNDLTKHKSMFIYPNTDGDESEGYDMEILNETKIFMLLCTSSNKVYELKGYDCELSEDEINNYKINIFEKYYGTSENLDIVKEEYGDESDEMMDYFG